MKLQDALKSIQKQCPARRYTLPNALKRCYYRLSGPFFNLWVLLSFLRRPNEMTFVPIHATPIGPNACYYEGFSIGDAWECAKKTIFGGRLLHGPAGFLLATGLESRLGIKEGNCGCPTSV